MLSERCPVPAAAAKLQSLPRVDYADAFRVDLPYAAWHDAESWTRVAFDMNAPSVGLLIRAIGLITAATPPSMRRQERVEGFRIGRRTWGFEVGYQSPEAVVLETVMWLALVQIVVMVTPSQPYPQLVMATFIDFRGS